MHRECVCVEHGPSECGVRRDPFELELEMGVDSDSDTELTEEEAWADMQVQARASPEMQGAMIAAKIETADQFLGYHGMMEQAGANLDMAVCNTLAVLHSFDRSIGTNIGCSDASCLRTLAIKAKRASNQQGPGKTSKIVVSGATGTVASTEAEEAKEATALYKHLLVTQGVEVDTGDHLSHSLISKMVTSLKKNGHINQCITLSDIFRQNERKRTTAIALNSQVEVSIGNQANSELEAGATNFSKIVLKLLLFSKGMAAIFGKEVTKTTDISRYSTLLVKPAKGTVGTHMMVHATYPEVMQYFELLLTAMSGYTLRFADSIFKRSFTKLMSLFDKHGFQKAVQDLKEKHGSHLRPSDEELASFENEKRTKATANERQNRELAERRAGEKARRDAVARIAGIVPGTVVKKPEDPNRPPCHGVAYSGICRRDGCTFDHNKERCAAFKAKNPSGAPGK